MTKVWFTWKGAKKWHLLNYTTDAWTLCGVAYLDSLTSEDIQEGKPPESDKCRNCLRAKRARWERGWGE